MATNDLQIKILLEAIDKATKPFRAITEQNRSLLKSIKDTSNGLKNLQSTEKDVGNFRTMSKGLRDISDRFDAAQKKVNNLAKEMAAADKPSRSLSRSFNLAKNDAKKLKEQLDTQSIGLQTLRNKLASAGISTHNLQNGQRELKQRIDQATHSMKAQQAELERINKKEQQLELSRKKMKSLHGIGMTAALHGAGAMYGGQRALRGLAGQLAPGIDFDTTMSKVQSLTRLNKSSDQLKQLRQQARSLGASTMFSATDAAQGQAFLAMAGFTPESIKAAMPGMLDLAKAGGTELGETADIASGILKGFQLPAQEMTRAGDVLVGTFTRSNVDLQLLGDTMKYVAPVASGLGISLETAAAMAGKLGDAGIQGSMAGTAMRAIFSRLAAPPAMAGKALKELNIQAKDAKGNLREMPDILKQIADKTRNMGNAQRSGFLKAIAGEEAFSALSVLVDQADKGGLQTLVKTLKASSGEAAIAAKTMGDNTAGSLDNLSSAWDDLRIELNEAVTPTLRELLDNLTDMLNTIGEWMRQNPELTKGIALIAAGVAIVITVLGALTIVIGSTLMSLAMMRLGFLGIGTQGVAAFTFIKNAIIGFSSVLARVATTFLANPLLLALFLLATAAFLIYKNWAPISQFFSNMWAGIKAAFDAGVLWVSDKFTALHDGLILLKDKFVNIGVQIVEGLWSGLTSRFEVLKQWFMSLGDKIPEWLREKLGIKSPSRVFATIGGYSMEGLAQGLNGEQNAPIDALKNTAQRMTSAGAGLMLGLSAGMASASPAIATGTSTGNNFNYTINIATQPGMDAEAIAKAVRRELEARDRQAASRQRSALYDTH